MILRLFNIFPAQTAALLSKHFTSVSLCFEVVTPTLCFSVFGAFLIDTTLVRLPVVQPVVLCFHSFVQYVLLSDKNQRNLWWWKKVILYVCVFVQLCKELHNCGAALNINDTVQNLFSHYSTVKTKVEVNKEVILTQARLIRM